MDPLDELEGRISKEQMRLAAHLMAGTPSDYAGYREIVGNMKSMDAVMTQINDIRKEMEKANG